MCATKTLQTPYVIAVDGPSGTGKSTTARLVAQELDLLYIDTGAMYRALTWKAMQSSVSAEDIAALTELARNTKLDFNKENEIMVDGVCRATEIRTPEVSGQVSHYCSDADVRAILTQRQRELGGEKSSILDGRDIGTVVFPHAQFKFFLVADYRVRAQRRLQELQGKGIESTLEEVEANLKERDQLDSTRETAPLRKAEDAIEIDTTELTIPQQVMQICDCVSGNAAQAQSSHNPSKEG